MQRRILSLTCLAALALSGCDIVDMGSRPSTLIKPTTTYSGALPQPWFLYSESLDTTGGLGLYDGGPANYANMTVDFNNTEHPHTGSHNIKLYYNTSLSTGGYIGGTFTHTPDFTTFNAVPGRDLSTAGYTKCTFWAASPESRKVDFSSQGVDIGYVQLSPAYQQFTITLPVLQNNVKAFFGFAFNDVNSVGPATCYIDDLEYTK